MHCSPDPCYIAKFRGKFTTKLDFNAATKKSEIEIRSQQHHEISKEHCIITLIYQAHSQLKEIKSKLLTIVFSYSLFDIENRLAKRYCVIESIVCCTFA